MIRYTYLVFLFFLSGLLLPANSLAQNNSAIIIKGLVTDAESNEPIPFASVELVNTKARARTNLEGIFSIVSVSNATKIRFSCVGYQPETRTVVQGKSQIINVKLKPVVTSLNEVVVRPPKKKYKNKNNPAVELIEKVIENKSKNRKEGFDFYQYEKYEKIQFALSNYSDKLTQRKSLRKFRFVFANADSTKIPGTKVLPMYMKETLSDNYYRKSPYATKEVVKANKMVTFEGYLDNQGMSAYLNYMYQDVKIYDNDISFLSNRFLSPIAGSAPGFYKYFLLDTAVISGDSCVKLLFAPRNKTDMLFQGFMYIMLDSSYAVKRIEMSVNKDINLNWVKDVNIVQEFERVEDKGMILNEDEISIDFGISKNGMGIFGQRSVSYKDYKINESISDKVFKGPDIAEAKDADVKNDEYWDTHRHQPLSNSEKGIYTMIDSVKRIPAFKRTMNIMMLLFSGYRDLGYFEIGPVNTFYSYNPIEGARVRFGGRTTPKFSPKINFETYLAYGYADKEFKYYLGTTYSLTDRNIYKFPVKSLKVSIQNETKIPGQELQFVQEDNILLSIKRGENDKLLYNKSFHFEHLNEFENHFSYSVGYGFTKQTPAGDLYFNPVSYSYMSAIPQIKISEVSLTLRYAPHEQFYQGKVYRIPIPSKYPVIQVNYTLGTKLLNNDYNYQSLRISFSRRFYPSVLGYTDVIWEAGKIFGRVPYPLLVIHRANQTYSYQIASYNLMNFLEFVSDQFVSLNIDHCFNGFIFNKIPLLKKLKFREVMTCKILYGSLSDRNDPAKQSGLFKFPVAADGTKITYTLEKQPYIEASAGVSNILRFFRIDLVKRFTYLDHPDIAKIGIRARFKFDF